MKREPTTQSHNMTYKVFLRFVTRFARLFHSPTCCLFRSLNAFGFPGCCAFSLSVCVSFSCSLRCIQCGHFAWSHCAVGPSFSVCFQWSCRMHKSSLQKHTHQVFYTRIVRPRMLGQKLQCIQNSPRARGEIAKARIRAHCNSNALR